MIKLLRVLENAALPSIKPSIDSNPPEGMSNFTFDRQLLLDVGVQLQSEQTVKEHQDIPCLVCLSKKCYPQQKMRGHIGYHILNDDIAGPIICGFCGEVLINFKKHPYLVVNPTSK